MNLVNALKSLKNVQAKNKKRRRAPIYFGVALQHLEDIILENKKYVIDIILIV